MTTPQNEPRSTRRVVKVTPAEVKAAKLNIKLNQRRGRKPPAWVIRVANAQPSRHAQATG